nr:FUSC family protein [Kofleriaceae bacterium]
MKLLPTEVPGAATLRHHVRQAATLQPTQPAIWLGLRCALATAAPLFLAPWLGDGPSTWATLGGFSLALIDKGGAYRTRAQTLLAFAVGGAVAIAAGTLAQVWVGAQLALIAIIVGGCALAQAWGTAATSVANSIAVQFVIAIALPTDPSFDLHAAAAVRAAGFGGGCAWALVLALLLWPVRVYRPGRRAIATCCSLLAGYVEGLAGVLEAAPETRDTRAAPETPDTRTGAIRLALAHRSPARDELLRRHRALRDALEEARRVLAATRRGRRGESGRGERLLVVGQALDQLFGTLLAIEDQADAASPALRAKLVPLVAPGLGAIARTLDELAARVQVEDALPPLADPWPALAPASDDPELALASGLVARAHAALVAASTVIDSLADDRELAPAALAPAVPIAPAPSPLRDLLHPGSWRESAVVRHAVRAAVVGLASVAVTRAFELERGYYVTVTALLLLQPYRAATVTKGIQRVAGTVAGGVVASVLAAALHDPYAIMVVVVLLAGASAAVLQLNYGLYALFLTPTFVLLADVHALDDRIIHVRIIDTLVGGALAFLGSALLWPTRERSQFADLMATAIEASAGYATAVAAAAAAGAPSPIAVAGPARRALGLALNNADAALDRVVAEHPAKDALEARLTLLLFTRRFASAVTALGEAGPAAQPALAALGPAIEGRLTAIASAVRAQTRPPLPEPPRPHSVANPVAAARVARIELQLDILSAAAARAAR